ncbi:MAG: glycosyltransferase family 2 protein [Desulfurococcales archaeon]|nr:glycosyltransferase family 2 protein [Desulfurococcales archaeon]MCE4605618.1 glycosyltransferase family 2 protein [Desulfurococcales archaeon]
MEECSKPEISIVVPTYNEAQVIGTFLDKVREELEEYTKCYEVIVVDDDSPDGTWRIVEEESKGDPRIRLVRRLGERGLATAVIKGIQEARSDLVIVMDADLQHPPEVVPKILGKAKEGYDIVVASRYARGGGVEGWSKARLAISRISSIVSKILVREARKTSDPMSGFFLVRKSIVRVEHLRPRGYKILLEILAKSPGARVADVPYTFRKRAAGDSKLGLRVMVDFILHLISLSRLARFAIVGGIGSILNLGVMYILLPVAGVDASSIAGIEAGILWNFILHEEWTFKSRFAGSVIRRLIGYHLSSLAGITSTYLVMRLLYTLAGVNPVLGQAIGIIVGFIANYTLSSGVVWRGAKAKTAP